MHRIPDKPTNKKCQVKQNQSLSPNDKKFIAM